MDHGLLGSAVYQDYESSLHRRKSISLPTEPTVTAKFRLIRPRCVSPMRKAHLIIWYESRLEAIAGGQHKNCVCVQEKHANTEGEMQMGATRADGCRRLDEETWEQCYDGATVARWSPVNRG